MEEDIALCKASNDGNGKLFWNDNYSTFYHFLEEDNAPKPAQHVFILKSLQMQWSHYIQKDVKKLMKRYQRV